MVSKLETYIELNMEGLMVMDFELNVINGI